LVETALDEEAGAKAKDLIHLVSTETIAAVFLGWEIPKNQVAIAKVVAPEPFLALRAVFLQSIGDDKIDFVMR
jgi:hypothetical protein